MKLVDWFRRRRPRPVPDALWDGVLAGRPFLACLTAEERQKLKILVERFLADKEFSTGGGLELSDEICVAIAAQGCLPVLQLGLAAYGDWVEIIVYPNEFVVPRQLADENGIVHEYTDILSGEAWAGGPLIISWHDAQMAGDGYNVVIHEFAHKLDMRNGEADGIPALHSGLTAETWDEIFLPTWDDFCRRVDSGEDTPIDPYASEHPAEFFAVFSECFFERPDILKREYPAYYALLGRYYRQDPLARLAACRAPSASADKT